MVVVVRRDGDLSTVLGEGRVHMNRLCHLRGQIALLLFTLFFVSCHLVEVVEKGCVRFRCLRELGTLKLFLPRLSVRRVNFHVVSIEDRLRLREANRTRRRSVLTPF